MNEAELVFMQVLNCKRQDLYLKGEILLDKEASGFISRVLRERISGKPVQYVLGKTEFMGLDFKLAPGVFIPRPETEILVETLLEEVARSPRQAVAKARVLDMGTGSGCIAVSLAKLLPDIEVTASDISSQALAIARENAKLNNVEINFINSNLFDAFNLAAPRRIGAAGYPPRHIGVVGTPLAAAPLSAGRYNLIACNPPYIPSLEIEQLQREVRCEPRIALDGGRDGLDFYRRIVGDSPVYLEEGGQLILEIGFTQRQDIERIVHSSKRFSISRVVRDYNDIERVVVLKKNRS